MDLYRESSFTAPKDSKRKARLQPLEMSKKDTHYTIILDNKGEGSLDLNVQITLLNQLI